MLGGLFFNEAAIRFHHDLVKNCTMQCNTVLTHPQLVEANQVPAKGSNVGQLLTALSENLMLFLNRSDNELELAGTKSEQSALFHRVIFIARIKSMTYCTYLAQTLDLHNPHATTHSKESLSPFRGYFLILAAVNAYNLALQSHQENQVDKTVALLVAALKWLEDVEINHLGEMNDDVTFSLRKQLVTKISALQLAISRAERSQIILPQDLQRMIERKIQRAARFALPYHGEVVCAENVASCYVPDPQSVELLCQNLQAMTVSPHSQRKQILFYYNLPTGHVELIDAEFDATTQQLYLINISSTHMASQYLFLQTLTKHLNDMKISFHTIACQANIQRDGISCLLYAYAFSGIVARLSYAQLADRKFHTTQPTFFDVSHRDGYHREPIPNTLWCSIHALGNKASLMSQSFSFMQESLQQIHSVEITKSLIGDFKTKYGLMISEDMNIKRTYIDYLRNHFARCLHPDVVAHQITLQKLQNKFKGKAATIEDGQMVRRAVVFGTTDEFDVLLNHFAKLSLSENPLDAADKTKGLTPFYHALQKQTPGRALKLLATEKISLEKAREHFAALPADSAMAQNPSLQKSLK